MVRIKEKRRRKRIDVALLIKIEYNDKKILTNTKNISLLGTYLETDKEIPIGTALDINIKITQAQAGKKKIACQGNVFRCKPTGLAGPKNQYGVGIFFRSFLGKDGEKDLSNYIDYIISQEKKMGKIYIHKRKQISSKRKGGRK